MGLLSKIAPSRSVLAGGTAGLIAWGIGLVARHYGVEITETQMTLLVSGIGYVITHVVPDSLKDHAKALNVQIQDIAKILPEAQGVYPQGKNPQEVKSNQVWKEDGN